jgi:hypothetical protein
MNRSSRLIAPCLLFALLPTLVVAADQAEPAAPAKPASSDGAPDSTRPQATPPTAAPADVTATAPVAPPPEGQWVYTEQYGWVWMPYGNAYTHIPSDGNDPPYIYVYEPALGWAWVVWGPVPYFGIFGGVRFGWWGHGWGPGWRGWRPRPYRSGFPYHHGFIHHR